jgi:FtsP/CotA-like multicopper oxidase with cupredoxin domain
MTIDLNRRQFLTTTLALAAASGVSQLVPDAVTEAAAGTALASLVVDRRTIEVKGKAASVFGLRQQNKMWGLHLDPDQRFQLNLINRSDEATVIHWHGQTPPNLQDGVTETGTPLVGAGATRAYDFAPRPGTHWMHSHYGLQEQRLLAAPLVVRTADDLRLDAQEVTVLLHDFSFREPAEILAQLSHGAMAMPSMGGHSGHTMSGMAMGNQPTDLNDVEYDAYLANDRTLDDPAVFRTERNGRVRLRLINGATSTAFWIDLGAAVATVMAVDGDPVRPITGSRFPLAQGQRIDLLIPMPAERGVIPVFAQREGDRIRTGAILVTPGATISRFPEQADAVAEPIDLSLEHRLVSATPLSVRASDVTHRIALTGSMMPYVWGIDDRNWSEHKPLRVAKGQRVVLEMANRSPMAHPMHLHGHHFQVVGLNGKALAGAMRDTVLVPADRTVTIAFDADNPGHWLLHCHNLFHMAIGMMTELAYGPNV